MKTTIAINFGSKGFKTIEAEKVDIHGIPCAVHKSINKTGWSVSTIEQGVALISKAQSKALAIESALGAVAGNGLETTKAQLAKLPTAPPVACLEPHVASVQVKVTVDLEGIINAIHNTVPLTPKERDAVRLALNSRTGRLKAKSPSAFGGELEQLAAAAWLSLQPNAYKIKVFSVLSLRGPAKELYDKLSKFRWPSALDKDRHNLEKLGVW